MLQRLLLHKSATQQKHHSSNVAQTIKMIIDELYMYRCLELAAKGAGYVAPNPMVGAVLVYNNRIIGEGYHEQYGQAHAEVNCINSVVAKDKHLIADATMYVSLEPCAHYGKTPPCADKIIAENIKHVIIGCRDPFKEVDGKGIEKLQVADINITLGILENECKEMNKRFFTFQTKHRPYIILKWAQTANKKIALVNDERLLISNDLTNKLVHKWRSEEAAILVGTNTVLLDDPALNNRLWSGRNPLRLIVDMHLRLPFSLKVFNKQQASVVFNLLQHDMNDSGLSYYRVTEDVSIVHQVLNACYQHNIQSILVEGGAKLLQSFIDEGAWDEARVITNELLTVEQGLPAPTLNYFSLLQTEHLLNDKMEYYRQSQ
ncbi:bifunctional diaminohydroxyphosphoribosylaminopyrimidine deaminase/5-amino-6-(5-phosphoribosylamino)uracil reductase RibD [soil metagenome]